MIETSQFVHPREEILSQNIYNTIGIKNILKIIAQEELDNVCRYIYSSSAVRLPSDNAAVVSLTEGCALFGVEKDVPVYLERDYYSDVKITGFNEPIVIVSDELLRNAPEPILRGRMMAAAASIKAEHNKLFFLTWLLDNFKGIIPIPGLDIGISSVLYEWDRVQEYTSDRAFYLATEDRELALKNILYGEMPNSILENFTFERGGTFEAQVDAFHNADGVAGLAGNLAKWFQMQSWLPERYSQLQKFIDQNRVTGVIF